jgi:hypothetical protein
MNSIGSASSSNYLSSLSSVQSSQPVVNSSSDPDGDGDGGGSGKVHKSRHGGGQLAQQLMQALQSLGVAMPQQPGAANAAPNASGSKDGDSDDDGSATSSASASGNIKHDLHQVMHALFQAIKAEKATGTAGNGSSTTDPQTSFASGLSDLIAKAGNGSAPAGLQDAFSTLMNDLQQGAASSATAPSNTARSTQPTLQAFLTQLQQNLGYGKSTLDPTGNVVSTQA